jgi:excisionase family DNA binding protein
MEVTLIDKPGRWLTVRECSAYIHVHPQTLYRLTLRRKIPHAKVPGIGIRIDKEALDQFLELQGIQPKDFSSLFKHAKNVCDK